MVDDGKSLVRAAERSADILSIPASQNFFPILRL